MTVTTNDAIAKMVKDELLDLDTRSTYLSKIWQPLMGAMMPGQSLDIGELGSLNVEDAYDSSFAPQTLTVQSLSVTANNLVIDQAKAISAEITQRDRLFQNNGALLNQLARKLFLKIANDRDTRDFAYLAKTIAYDTSATYHLNVDASAIAVADVENTMAAIMSERSGYEGAPFSELVWMFHPFGIGSIRLLPGYSRSAVMSSDLGVPQVGTLNDRPVFVSQSVARNASIATSAVTISSNVATATVASGHGFVPGQIITTTGLTTNVTTVAITSVTATTIVYPCTASNGAFADGVGTITGVSCLNALVRQDWLWEASVPDWLSRVIPYGPTRTTDVVQAQQTWGRKSRAGAVYILESPGSTVS